MVDNESPPYVAEFRRWRSAPPDQRKVIARDQECRFLRRDLFPDAVAAGDTDAVAPNGKHLGECSMPELTEIAEWLVDIRDAAVARAALVTAHDLLTGVRF